MGFYDTLVTEIGSFHDLTIYVLFNLYDKMQLSSPWNMLDRS